MGTRAQSQEWIQGCLTGNTARAPALVPRAPSNLQASSGPHRHETCAGHLAFLSLPFFLPCPPTPAHWASCASLFLVALFSTPLQFIPLLRSPLSSEFPISSLHTIFCQSEPFTPQPDHLLLLKTLPCWSVALKTKSRWLLNQPLRPGVRWPSPPPQPP